MMGYQFEAAEKLRNECKELKGDKYQAIMKGPVRDALIEFCRQNEEFAQAVVQGGTFADCMKAVSKGITSSLSDIEAYRRAAAFYFDGAAVEFQMVIRLEPAAPRDDGGIIIDLTSFF